MQFGKGAYFCYDELAGKLREKIPYWAWGCLYLVNGYYLSCMISIHLSVVLSLKMQQFIQSYWTLDTSADLEFPFDCPETISEVKGEIADHVVPLSDHSELILHHTDSAFDKTRHTIGHSISHELSGTECFIDKLGFYSSQIVDTLLAPNDSAYSVRKPPKCLKQFDQIEFAGTEVTYRCVECRDCLKGKNGNRVDAISIQAEMEQSLIDRPVEVDVERGRLVVVVVVEPDSRNRLGPSERGAVRVFQGQLKILSKLNDKRACERKLEDLGFVGYISNLSDEEKALIINGKVRYFIPWKAVYNETSQTTSCRLVFDASQSTQGGCSLNSLLAKWASSMNKLVEIMMWLTRPHAFQTDISKMYNVIHLSTRFWRYQLPAEC